MWNGLDILLVAKHIGGYESEISAERTLRVPVCEELQPGKAEPGREGEPVRKPDLYDPARNREYGAAHD